MSWSINAKGPKAAVLKAIEEHRGNNPGPNEKEKAIMLAALDLLQKSVEASTELSTFPEKYTKLFHATAHGSCYTQGPVEVHSIGGISVSVEEVLA